MRKRSNDNLHQHHIKLVWKKRIQDAESWIRLTVCQNKNTVSFRFVFFWIGRSNEEIAMGKMVWNIWNILFTYQIVYFYFLFFQYYLFTFSVWKQFKKKWSTHTHTHTIHTNSVYVTRATQPNIKMKTYSGFIWFFFKCFVFNLNIFD